MKWKREVFTRSCRGEQKSTLGYTIGQSFGIHKGELGKWSVTHLGSGMAVNPHDFRFPTIKAAKAYVHDLLPVADWPSVTSDTAPNEETARQISTIMRRHKTE